VPPGTSTDTSDDGEEPVTSESIDAEADAGQRAVESEGGALVAVLVMVVLGVAGIFAVSA
jgi:hypothetical protein